MDKLKDLLKSKKIILSIAAVVVVIVSVIAFDVPLVDTPKVFEKVQTCISEAVTPAPAE